MHTIAQINPSFLARTSIFGVPVDVSLHDPQELLTTILSYLSQSCILVTFVNPASALASRQNPAYRWALSAFNVVSPDGIGICLALKWLHGTPVRRVSFDNTSLAPVLFEIATRRQFTIVLVGGRPGVAERAKGTILNHYPHLRIVGVLDGYGDLDEKVTAVSGLVPDIVICGMGFGLQEFLLLKLRDSGWLGCGLTCGGFFDQLGDAFHYYPSWINSAHLRWAYRLFREPRRLCRRYLIDYGYFLFRFSGAMAKKVYIRIWSNNMNATDPGS